MIEIDRFLRQHSLLENSMHKMKGNREVLGAEKENGNKLGEVMVIRNEGSRREKEGSPSRSLSYLPL
jgi:hypothetical protein